MNTSDALHIALSDRIHDAEVGLRRVPLSLLGEFQRDVTDFLRGATKEVDTSKLIVSLEDGSLAIVVSGLSAAVGLWSDLDRLDNPGALGLIDPRRAEVMQRWQAAVHKNPHRRYRLADSFGNHAISIDAQTDFRNQVASVWVPVQTYLSGTVVDWGGKVSPNIHLQLNDGRTVTVASTQKLLADEPENRLYKPALLHVSADQNLLTRELRNFSLLGFAERHPTWDEAEFDRLVQKGTKAWADTDDEWLERLRGGNG